MQEFQGEIRWILKSERESALYEISQFGGCDMALAEKNRRFDRLNVNYRYLKLASDGETVLVFDVLEFP